VLIPIACLVLFFVILFGVSKLERNMQNKNSKPKSTASGQQLPFSAKEFESPSADSRSSATNATHIDDSNFPIVVGVPIVDEGVAFEKQVPNVEGVLVAPSASENGNTVATTENEEPTRSKKLSVSTTSKSNTNFSRTHRNELFLVVVKVVPFLLLMIFCFIMICNY
jgi:hypothetical protein